MSSHLLFSLSHIPPKTHFTLAPISHLHHKTLFKSSKWHHSRLFWLCKSNHAPSKASQHVWFSRSNTKLNRQTHPSGYGSMADDKDLTVRHVDATRNSRFNASFICVSNYHIESRNLQHLYGRNEKLCCGVCQRKLILQSYLNISRINTKSKAREKKSRKKIFFERIIELCGKF